MGLTGISEAAANAIINYFCWFAFYGFLTISIFLLFGFSYVL